MAIDGKGVIRFQQMICSAAIIPGRGVFKTVMTSSKPMALLVEHG